MAPLAAESMPLWCVGHVSEHLSGMSPGYTTSPAMTWRGRRSIPRLALLA